LLHDWVQGYIKGLYRFIYFQKERKKNNASELEKLVITIDQPLYWKAKCIVDAEPAVSALRYVIVVLNGFDTRKSFLGAIAFLMTESGILETKSQSYTWLTLGEVCYKAKVSRLLCEAMVCWR